jgi:hypothetical protein
MSSYRSLGRGLSPMSKYPGWWHVGNIGMVGVPRGRIRAYHAGTTLMLMGV